MRIWRRQLHARAKPSHLLANICSTPFFSGRTAASPRIWHPGSGRNKEEAPPDEGGDGAQGEGWPRPLCLPPSSGRKMAAAAGSMRATAVTGRLELDEAVYAEEEGVCVFMALLWLHRGPWGIGWNTSSTTDVWTDQPGGDRIDGSHAWK